MYKYMLIVGNCNVFIHTKIHNCLNVFMLDEFVRKGEFSCCGQGKTKCEKHIYLFEHGSVVSNCKESSKKIKKETFDIYISNRQEDPKGIIIEKKRNQTPLTYIVIAENNNSQIIFLRSILIKLFFSHFTKIGGYPLHCSAVMHKENGYIFLADSLGGKSTVYFTFAAYGLPDDYILLTDDTLLCRFEKEKIAAYSMPLKPSLRAGTITNLKPMEIFRTNFEKSLYGIEDQIYVDLSQICDLKVNLSGKIDKAFFIQHSENFSVEKLTDPDTIKKKLLLSICQYKATPVDLAMVDFLNAMVSRVAFYRLYIPGDMDLFFKKFCEWEGKNKR